MTTIGLEYVKHKEAQRHNKADEDIKRDTLDETVRSHKADESIKRDTLDETITANRNREEIQKAQLDEQIRKDKSDEKIKLTDQALDKLSGLAAEQSVRNQIYDPETGNWYAYVPQFTGDATYDWGVSADVVGGRLLETAREFLTRQKVKLN